MTLGREIKKARAGLGWQQQQLAQITGISQKYLSRVENDKADPSWSIVRRLIAALDLDLRTIAREDPTQVTTNDSLLGMDVDVPQTHRPQAAQAAPAPQPTKRLRSRKAPVEVHG